MDSRACRALGRTALVVAIALVAAAPAVADPNVIPIAGGAPGTALGDGGAATDATLIQPQQTAVLHDYDFYYRDYVIADYDHCRIRQVSYDPDPGTDVGKIDTVVGGTSCGDSAAATNTNAIGYKLDRPTSVSATPERQI